MRATNADPSWIAPPRRATTTICLVKPKKRTTEPKTSTRIAKPAIPNALPIPVGPAPANATFHAKYGPKIIGSQEMPTRAKPPPGALLNNNGDQPCSSPIKRRMVMASVMIAGTRISLPTLTFESVPFISLLQHSRVLRFDVPGVEGDEYSNLIEK